MREAGDAWLGIRGGLVVPLGQGDENKPAQGLQTT